MVFQPQHAQPDERVAERIEGLERWWREADGARVEAWYLPPLTPEADGGPAVIFAHGNRELIEHWVEPLTPYREMGLAVLLPEYRSYGRSTGIPSEAALLDDFGHFYDRLSAMRQIDRSRIVFHGRSLGGGVVGVLSDRHRAAALILESTFTSMPDLASQWWAPDFAITDRFDTRAVLMRASTPALIVHALDDELIPFRHAIELHRVAWDSRLVPYRHGGHNGIPRDRVYWDRVRAFLLETGVLSESVNPR